jgi:hypothetical protein
MLAEDTIIPSETSPTAAAATAVKGTTSFRLSTTSMGTAKAKTTSTTAGGASNKVFGGSFGGSFMDDEDEPTRKLILLHDEELHQQIQPTTGQEEDDTVMDYGRDGLPIQNKKQTLQETLAHISQSISTRTAAMTAANTAGSSAGVPAAPTNPNSAIPASVHAQVLAQAQAIAASIQKQQGGNAAPATTSVPAPEDPKEILKKLVDQIPSEKEDLFAYPINWQSLDAHQVINAQLSNWIVKKIIEYLGVEEESLTKFIVSKLLSHCQAHELMEELNMVLDEDAENFVMKLWKMLIYYSLKIQYTGSA